MHPSGLLDVSIGPLERRLTLLNVNQTSSNDRFVHLDDRIGRLRYPVTGQTKPTNVKPSLSDSGIAHGPKRPRTLPILAQLGRGRAVRRQDDLSVSGKAHARGKNAGSGERTRGVAAPIADRAYDAWPCAPWTDVVAVAYGMVQAMFPTSPARVYTPFSPSLQRSPAVGIRGRRLVGRRYRESTRWARAPGIGRDALCLHTPVCQP